MVGYLLRRYGFQVGPIILGVILGPMIDANYRRAMIGAREDIGLFALDFLTHPISLVLTIGLLLMLISQTPAAGWLRSRWRRLRKEV
jgi:putative tricarboxylic transport membrane protein